MTERKMPRRWVYLIERWYKYNDYVSDSYYFNDSDDFTLTYDEALEELEDEAHYKNKAPEEEFLSIRTVFEMQLDRMEKTGEQRKKRLIQALVKIYKELD